MSDTNERSVASAGSAEGDIVCRLSAWRDERGFPTPGEMMDEAAAEIARLRKTAATPVGEPVAWGVMRVGGGWRCIVDNERQAASVCKGWDRAENWVHEAIPLYRSPTLTDAEREAIWFFAAIDSNDPVLGSHAATLRALLERLK